MKPFAIACLVVVCLAAPSWAADGNIGLFFSHEPDCQCTLTIPCGCSGRMYVYGLLQGASSGGITGAEYKIAVGTNTSPDPGWLFVESFDLGATVLGAALNPADNLPRGVNVAWPACQQGDGVKVLIETVDILHMGCTFSELPLQVVKHDNASNAYFQCPLFVLCDAPVYTKVCLGFVSQCQNPNPPFPNDAFCSTSGQAWINPVPSRVCCLLSKPAMATCKIQVDDGSWTRVKSLYRD